MVECSDILVGIGGGGIGTAEMLAGKAQGKPVYYFPADMNHARAISHAKRMGLPPLCYLGVQIPTYLKK